MFPNKANSFIAAYLNGCLYTDKGKLIDRLLTMDAHGNHRLTHMLQFHAAPLSWGEMVELPNELEIYEDGEKKSKPN